MISAFRYMVNTVGISVQEASVLASGNPARMLGMDDKLGSLAVGKQADILLLTPDLDISSIWVKGKQTV
jgi:N-acetylglucosamine-6-phosphate deacetylase